MQHGDAGVRLQRLGADADHLAIPDLRAVEIVDQWRPGDRESGRVEQVLDLAQHRQQTARAVEVLHQELAGRLQVDQQRHVGPDGVEVVEA